MKENKEFERKRRRNLNQRSSLDLLIYTTAFDKGIAKRPVSQLDTHKQGLEEGDATL
jgi:hypothetical protein